MKTAALLLEDEDNLYQQMLSREAKHAAERLGVVVLEPEFAESSSWNQIEAVNAHLRRDPPPDALMIVLAGEQYTRPTFERVAEKGVALAFLNRIPDWVRELREEHPGGFAVGVTPRQVDIGRIQGRQALALARPGSSVLLVTGSTGSVTAVERTRGFREVVEDRLTVHVVDGHWSTPRARKALDDWLRHGPAGGCIDLAVCQNDAMAAGVRSALAERATASGREELRHLPVTGCDGLEDEGQAMLARGDLSATVVLPPTTPAALETLKAWWEKGERQETVFVDATSFPPLEALDLTRATRGRPPGRA